MNVQQEIDRILAESSRPISDLKDLRDELRQCLSRGFPTGSWWANDTLIEGAIEQLRRHRKSKKARP